MTSPSRRSERAVALWFGLAAVSGIGLAAIYLRGGHPQREGLFLCVGLASLGAGFVVWSHRLMPTGPFEQARHPLPSETAERDAFEDDIDRGAVTRRTLITRSLGAALVAFGAAALFPIRSLGPRPGRSLLVTPWRRGLKLVTDDGTPVHIDSVPLEGLVTVFPEGSPGSADGQAVLIRVASGLIDARPGREDWSPDGFIAYSKVCTHAGCPVGLYQAESHQLLCPCHQSTFDVLDSARPKTGPAAAPLPQLPLAIDPDGFLVAQGDFSEPVGPVFWRHT